MSLRLRRATVAVLLACGWLAACQPAEPAWLALRLRTSAAQTRRFPPGEPPPLWVNVRVFRSDDLLGPPVVNLDADWESLAVDPTSGRRLLALAVPATDGQDYQYLVRVSSVIDDGSGAALVDECGVAGRISAPAGQQVEVELATHLGDCSPLLCQLRSDCVGTRRYCLAFECYDQAPCGQCPTGAGCDADSLCSGDCQDQSDCSAGFGCCLGTCSSHCPGW